MGVRYKEIDYLKVIAVITVIFIHTLARYRSDSVGLYLTWDLIHFAVGLFVFASGFLMQMKEEKDPGQELDWGSLWKRIVRLVKPYYGYVVVHALLILLLPMFLDDFSIGRFLNPSFLLKTVFLSGGVGNNWIPRVFVSMSLLYFVERHLSRWLKNERLIYFFFVLTLSSTILFHFVSWGGYSWFLGWYSVLQLGRIVYRLRGRLGEEMRVLLYSVFGLGISIIVMNYFGERVALFSNKYPPTFFFVMYQFVVSIVVLIPLRYLGRYLERFVRWDSFVSWVSVHSYELFFAHIIAMDLIVKGGRYWLEWGGIVFLSLLGVWVVENLVVLVGRIPQRVFALTR
jgi:hypothetical protein